MPLRPHERIPDHDHSDHNSGGPIAAQSITGLPAPGSTTTSSGGAANLNDLGDVDTATTPPVDNDLLAYDTTTSTWTPRHPTVVQAHGSLGATETFDPSVADVHTGTLDANLTVTLTAPVTTGCIIELWLTQDGTGGRTVTWPGSVIVNGTLATTASTTSVVILETVDGGTNWVAFVAGGGSTVAALDDLTDVTITSVASGDRLRYNGTAWVNSTLAWVPLTNGDATTPELIFAGGDVVMTEVTP